jgi:Helix-turn-helix domain
MDAPSLIGPGVFVPAWQCGTVLDAVAEYVRRHQIADPSLAALAVILRAATLPLDAATGGRNVTPRPEWLTVGDYAKGAGVSERTVRDRCARGVIPGAERIEGRWRIPVSATPPPH